MKKNIIILLTVFLATVSFSATPEILSFSVLTDSFKIVKADTLHSGNNTTVILTWNGQALFSCLDADGDSLGVALNVNVGVDTFLVDSLWGAKRVVSGNGYKVSFAFHHAQLNDRGSDSAKVKLTLTEIVPLPTGFGSGSNAGTFSANVWTPGVDGSGLVNAVSWSIVPKNQWITVANTKLNSLDDAVKAAIPGWKDWGVEGWNGVTDAWNGMAIDVAGSRMWLSGGGHSASGNNGIYRFDAFKMAWAIEDLPSDPALWSAAYINSRSGGSFSFCNESYTAMLAKQAAGTLQPINDLFYDELPWDGKPTSRHTYSSMVYVPESNELVMVCRRLWRYSLTEGRWTYKRLIHDTPDLFLDGENMVAIYDEATREVLVSAAGSSGIYHATGYSLTNNEWTNWGSPWNLYSSVADVRDGRRIVIVQPGCTAGGGYGAQPLRYWDYNLDSRSVTANGEMQLAGSLQVSDFAPANWFYDGAALTYLPTLNRFWLWTWMSSGAMGMLEIDPTTSPWTVSLSTSTAGDFPVPKPIMERKMIYLPALNAVLLYDTASKDMYIYKL